VDRGWLIHFIGDVNHRFIAFGKAKRGGWNAAIDGDFFDRFASNVYRQTLNRKRVFDVLACAGAAKTPTISNATSQDDVFA
jgi:hypothetical protein